MAEFNFDLGGACEKIVRHAEDLASDGSNYAFNMQRRVGALDMITSADNGGVDADLISWNQRKKIGQLKVQYEQRTKPCQVRTGDDAIDANVCDTGTTPAILETTVQISERLATPNRDFTNEEMVVICEDTESFIRKFLLNDLRAAREKFSEVILAQLDEMIGVNRRFNGDETPAGSYTNLQLLAANGGQYVPLPGNYADLVLDYENMQFSGIPAVIGQGYFDKYMQLEKMSCCNSATPYAQAVEGAGLAFFKDQAANAVLGANKVLMLPFGIVHLLTFNENRNININSETVKHIVIPDPAGYPIDWDLDFKWDECTKTWKFLYSFYFRLFNIFQDDSFAGNSPEVSPACEDENLGVNGVWGYQITNAA